MIYITNYQLMQEWMTVSAHLRSTLRTQQAQTPAARHQRHSFDFSRSCTSRLARRSLCCAESSHGSDATRWDAWLSCFEHGEGCFVVIGVVRSGYLMHLEMSNWNPTAISFWHLLNFLNASTVIYRVILVRNRDRSASYRILASMQITLWGHARTSSLNGIDILIWLLSTHPNCSGVGKLLGQSAMGMLCHWAHAYSKPGMESRICKPRLLILHQRGPWSSTENMEPL